MSFQAASELPRAPSLILDSGGAGLRPSSGGGAGLAGGPSTFQSAAEVQAALAEIGKVRAVVERLEARMGRNNPQVGKAWLSLARMYQHVGGGSKLSGATSTMLREAVIAASEALSRARAVCREFASGMGLPEPQACEESFAYLQSRCS